MKWTAQKESQLQMLILEKENARHVEKVERHVKDRLKPLATYLSSEDTDGDIFNSVSVSYKPAYDAVPKEYLHMVPEVEEIQCVFYIKGLGKVTIKADRVET